MNIKRMVSLLIKKTRVRQYSTETITDADYTNDLALLANTHAQINFLFHCQEQTARDIDIFMNSDKICVIIKLMSSLHQMANL